MIDDDTNQAKAAARPDQFKPVTTSQPTNFEIIIGWLKRLLMAVGALIIVIAAIALLGDQGLESADDNPAATQPDPVMQVDAANPDATCAAIEADVSRMIEERTAESGQKAKVLEVNRNPKRSTLNDEGGVDCSGIFITTHGDLSARFGTYVTPKGQTLIRYAPL